VPLGLSIARKTAETTIEYRLKGGYAIYVAVAEAFDAALTSWDAEMLQRSLEFLTAMPPSHWLKDELRKRLNVSNTIAFCSAYAPCFATEGD
jgi:hypothetical protein